MMIKHYLTIGLILITIISCANSKRADSLSSGPGSKSETEQSQSKIICSNIKPHKFSSHETLDTFKIWIEGESLLNSDVHFEIINSDKEKIYSVVFKSYLLLNYDISSDTIDFAKETFIKTRISKFFNEENFISPAIKDGETFYSDYSDKTIWDEISADKNSVGFIYLIGEEDKRSIAYSKKQKKAVIYFNCC